MRGRGKKMNNLQMQYHCIFVHFLLYTTYYNYIVIQVYHKR